MPRESVYPVTLPTPVGEGDDYPAMPTVEVGWNKSVGEVQVGLEAAGPALVGSRPSLVDRLFDERVEGIGRHLYDALERIGRTITDEGADPTGNPDHDVELTEELLGRMVLDAVKGGGDGDFTGWYTSLTRSGINRLIRTLRRARDDAFGRDE